MSGQGRDEKACPSCAETIKAASTKCRYCGFELLAAEPSANTGSRPVAGSVAKQRLDGDVPEPPALAPTRQGSGLPVFLAALVAVLAALLFFVTIPRADDHDVAPDGQVVSPATRSLLMDQGAKRAAQVLSYKAATLDADAAAARSVMTPAMGKQYDETIDKVRARVQKLGLNLTAKAASSALVSASSDQAKVLVFVNQTTSATGLKQKQLDQTRVLVTMTRSDGRWLISRVEAF